MKQLLFQAVLVLFLASSCSVYHVTSTDTTEHYYPAKPSENDVVYLETIDKAHEIIGIITINGERKQRSMDYVIQKMKREAAILGGDAITDIKTDATGIWKKLPAQEALGNAYVRANFTTSVAVFK